MLSSGYGLTAISELIATVVNCTRSAKDPASKNSLETCRKK